jgi:hypothetical protein
MSETEKIPEFLEARIAEDDLRAIVWAEAYSAGFQDGAGFGSTPNPYRSQS